MESNKQEKYDLLHDNPVAKDASGRRDVSWMSKHAAQSRLGSPLHDNRGLEHNKKGHTSNDGGKTWVHPEK
tara:strand:- start:683 stop:895 length:213 start_codon:yes stop_codon:yes gene_type:complete